jgi:hypothetical protein
MSELQRLIEEQAREMRESSPRRRAEDEEPEEIEGEKEPDEEIEEVKVGERFVLDEEQED